LKNETVRAITSGSLWGAGALAYAKRVLYDIDDGGDSKLKRYECVEIRHHKDVAKTIEEYERNGWRLHTYQTAGMGTGPLSYIVNHYLLFEKD
jgi:hypothetical protein